MCGGGARREVEREREGGERGFIGGRRRLRGAEEGARHEVARSGTAVAVRARSGNRPDLGDDVLGCWAAAAVGLEPAQSAAGTC